MRRYIVYAWRPGLTRALGTVEAPTKRAAEEIASEVYYDWWGRALMKLGLIEDAPEVKRVEAMLADASMPEEVWSGARS